MRTLSNNFAKYLMYFAFSIFAVGFTSCSDDDDIDDVIIDPDPDPTGSITVNDQTISGNTILVESVTVGQDSWLVARNTQDEDSPEIVSEAVFIEEGTHNNVELPLLNSANLTGNEDGDDITVMLHTDDSDRGTAGNWDYDGVTGVDDRITDTSGANISQSVNVTAPRVFADNDQMVTEEGDVTFSNINTGPSGGYIGLYAENEDGTINEDEMIGFSEYIQPGENENVTARFNEDYQYAAGQNVYPRLFTDNPADQQFTYTSSGGTEDIPETYGYDAATGQQQNVWNTSTTGGFTIGNSAPGAGGAM